MAQEFVENILEVHRKYRALIQDVFQGDQAFVGALDKACTAVINHRPPKQPAKAPELVTYLKKLSLKKTQLVQSGIYKSKTEFFKVIETLITSYRTIAEGYSHGEVAKFISIFHFFF